jgi:hypothetical protein
MATLTIPSSIIDSPIISKVFVKRSEITVRNFTDFSVAIVPLVAPMVTGSIVFWELITHGLPIDNIYGKVTIALIAMFLLEFCGMMFFDYSTQVSQYNQKKPIGSPNINQAWGWLAIISYVGISFLMVSTGTVIPAIYKFMGYSSDVEMLTPVVLPGFIIITFFTFLVHNHVGIMNTAYEKADGEAKAKAMADAKIIDDEARQRKAESERAQLESKLELEQRRAELELMRAQAEIEAIQAVSKVKVLKAEAKVAAVKQVETLTTISKESAQAEMHRLLAENPTISNRDLAKSLTEFGYKISHVSVSKWKVNGKDVENAH